MASTPSYTFAPTRIAFDDADMDSMGRAAAEVLERDGVVVLTGAYDGEACAKVRSDVLRSFEALGGGFDAADPNGTWDPAVLPAQSRRGMFQCVMSGAPPAREVRADRRWVELWTAMHRALGQVDPVTGGDVALVCSHDGINVAPPVEADVEGDRDWAHTDAIYTTPSNASIQGQFVFNGSQAVLRCTPKSHTFWEWIADNVMSLSERDRAMSGWFKPNDKKLAAIRAHMADVLGADLAWQIPVYAPEGSLVLWYSSTIHSATGHRFALPPPDAIAGSAIPPAHPLRDWRFVFYVTFFPLHLHDHLPGGRQRVEELAASARAKNRCTSHSTLKMFPKVGRCYDRSMGKTEYVDAIAHVMHNPEHAFDLWDAAGM